MSLSVGIVGLPNAGKSTLFNALASRRLAETAPRPFTTIDPNEAVVPVPDEDFEKLWDSTTKSQALLIASSAKQNSLQNDSEKAKKVPATVTFIDIAGLVKGAHKGEGLGNQFLAKIREVDAIVHVVRAFSNPQVTHSPASPKTASRGGHPDHEPGSLEQIIEDIEIVNLELELGGIEKIPTIYILNCDEDKLDDISSYHTKVGEKFAGEVITISAKLEEELIDLEPSERKQYLKELKIKSSGLELLIKKAYELLDLITFYTIKGPASTNVSASGSTKSAYGQTKSARQGERIISAWSLKKGLTALDAAERVHTDFAKNFIKAEVINIEVLLKLGVLAPRSPASPAGRLGEGVWKNAKEKGKIRLEGRDYVVQDKDVIEFKVGAG